MQKDCKKLAKLEHVYVFLTYHSHKKKLKMENYSFVGPPTKVPAELIDVWGGEYGCPVMDETGTVIGYAAYMPQYEGEQIEAITISGQITVIVG